jgi:hypothetical protein
VALPNKLYRRGEEIVKVTHKAIYDLLSKAAVDVAAEVVATQQIPTTPEAR